jgi:hypothetical protein
MSSPSRVDLANAYVLGEQILDRKYQTAVLETVAGVQNVIGKDGLGRRESPEHLSEEAICTLYDSTLAISPTRALVADLCDYATNHDELRKPDFDGLPREAPVNIPNAMLRVAGI